MRPLEVPCFPITKLAKAKVGGKTKVDKERKEAGNDGRGRAQVLMQKEDRATSSYRDLITPPLASCGKTKGAQTALSFWP